MKNYKIIIASFTFLFAVNMSSNAQDSVLKSAKDVDANVEKIEKQKDKVTQEADDKKVKATNEVDKVKRQAQNTANAEVEKSKGKANNKMSELKSEYAETKRKYAERIDQATSASDKKKLEKEMMDKLSAIKGKAGNAKTNVEKNPVKDAKDKAKVKATDAMQKTDATSLKGKDLGMAKVNAAKAKIAKNETAINDKAAMIASGKKRVKAATERLEKGIADGTINEEQATAKRAIIQRVQDRIDKLEGTLETGREVISTKKASLTDMYSN